jgi:hypothetical protein
MEQERNHRMAKIKKDAPPVTLESLLDEYENAACMYATETGPDADYRRYAREEMQAARQAVIDFVRKGATE